ncbi:MAG: hypothetical protein KF893_26440 [Caldilineaceae bacterium]|nr:hypothetical protein [Caldilineaceae bacterium]
MVDRKSSNYRPLIIGLLVVFSIWVVIGLYWYHTGLWFSDATVTELHICLDDTNYEPVQVVPASTQQFYLCGRVIRTGQVSAGFQLFRGHHYIAGKSIPLRAGIFFIPVSAIVTRPFTEVFQPDEYRANVIVAQLTVAETLFQIVE